MRNLMFPGQSIDDSGSTHLYFSDKKKVMVRILTHLYLHEHITTRRLKAAFAKMDTECATLPVRT